MMNILGYSGNINSITAKNIKRNIEGSYGAFVGSIIQARVT